MSETQAKESDSGMDVAHLMDIGYGQLMNAARSAREQFDELEDAFEGLGRGLTKEGICEEMAERGFDYSDGQWTVPIDGEREEIELLEVQTNQGSSGSSSNIPSDETVLYGLTRANTEEYIDELREAIEENSRFETRRQDADSGTKYVIYLPAEEHEGYEEAVAAAEAEEEDEEAEDSESESDAADEDSAEDEGETSEESEESTESEESGSQTEESEEAEAESEDAEEPEDEDDRSVDAETVRSHWEEDKTKDELYNMAVEEDIDDRSNMSKSELIDALIEAKDEVSA